MLKKIFRKRRGRAGRGRAAGGGGGGGGVSFVRSFRPKASIHTLPALIKQLYIAQTRCWSLGYGWGVGWGVGGRTRKHTILLYLVCAFRSARVDFTLWSAGVNIDTRTREEAKKNSIVHTELLQVPSSPPRSLRPRPFVATACVL